MKEKWQIKFNMKKCFKTDAVIEILTYRHIEIACNPSFQLLFVAVHLDLDPLRERPHWLHFYFCCPWSAGDNIQRPKRTPQRTSVPLQSAGIIS